MNTDSNQANGQMTALPSRHERRSSRPPGATHEQDFFQSVRSIESFFRELPRLGRGRRAKEEPLRIGQEPELSFSPNTIDSIELDAQGTIQLRQRFLGLFGPNGPLPLEWTQQLRDQIRHDGDDGLEAFLDIFHHRLAIYFYRAWAEARPIVQRDRPTQDRFASFVDSLLGITAPTEVADADSLTDSGSHDPSFDSRWVQDTLRYFSGLLTGQHRNSEGLQSLLSNAFSVDVRVFSFAANYLQLDPKTYTVLTAGSSAALGRNTVLGRRVSDRTSTILVQIGPLDEESFSMLVPQGIAHRALCDLIHAYVGPAVACRVQLVLNANNRPSTQLGMTGRLGTDGWIGNRSTAQVTSDCHFTVNQSGSVDEH